MKRRSIGFVLGCGLAAFSVLAWFAARASIYHAIDDELRARVRGVAKFMDLQIRVFVDSRNTGRISRTLPYWAPVIFFRSATRPGGGWIGRRSRK